MFNGMSFFYYDMIVLDDASTSDDSDYLIGNINFSKEFMSASVEEEGGNGEIIFTPTYFETADETEYVNTHTKEILAELGTSQMSDYSKVKAVHDYVCALITYTNDVDNASSVYGAYVRGKGLCTVTHFACTNCLWKRACRAIGSEEVPVPGEILPVMRGTL